MWYHLKKIVFSWRFLILLIMQVAMYYYMNHYNLSRISFFPNFYGIFLNSLQVNIPLLALLCAGLIGLHTFDELDKNYQPLLFSRALIREWVFKRFSANALAGGFFIVLAWAGILIFSFFSSFPLQFDAWSLSNFELTPYISIVSESPALAMVQMILLDLVRVFLFGLMLGGIATLGATAFLSRYESLAFPAIFAIIFDHYLAYISPGMSWYVNFNLINLAGRYIEHWFSFSYFLLSALGYFVLAYYFVLRRVRYE